MYKVYKITSPNTEKVYIGSTSLDLDLRLKRHVNHSKQYNGIAKRYNKERKICPYLASDEVIKYGGATITEIESHINKDESRYKEAFYILTLPNTVNMRVPKCNDKVKMNNIDEMKTL